MEENKTNYKSCLRDTIVMVKLVKNKRSDLPENHVLSNGMAENSVRYYSTPILPSGTLKQVLTDNEKGFLEEYMNLEPNALSRFKKTNNFWTRQVKLKKRDNSFHLLDPNQFMDYKILLANSDYIAPSYEELKKRPKETYQYYMVESGTEEKASALKYDKTKEAYKLLFKIEEDIDTLTTIASIASRRPIKDNTDPSYIRGIINKLIQDDVDTFLVIATDETLDSKVLLKKAANKRIVSIKNNLYSFENEALCGNNQQATFEIAAAYLTNPKNQELKLAIEAKLKSKK